MLFLHTLIFFLLGTSVIAIPFLPGYKDQEHEDRVQNRRPLLFPGSPPELRWFFRIPKDEKFMNDVFEIHHDGSITFYKLNAIGEGHPDVLTALNSERILGDWRPMPTVSCLPQFYNLCGVLLDFTV
jgi:hypothetical protein